MSYVHHTKCIETKQFKPLGYKAQPAIEMLVLFGGTLAWIAVLIPVVLGNPLCALHALGLIAYGGLFGYCNWWLNHRLVCLSGDQCAIGVVLSVEPPGQKAWPDSYDTDFSVNLLLPNTAVGVKQSDAAASQPFGHLLKATPEVAARTDIPLDGYRSRPNGANTQETAVLHAEFEGAGVWIMFLSSAAALMLTVGAIFVCQVPVWGWIVSIILAALALIIALLAALFSQNDAADPADVSPDVADLHPAQGDAMGEADVLYVFGTHVYDGGHTAEGRGWSEIHPIKAAAKVGRWTGDWRTAVDTNHPSLDEHCKALTEAIGTAKEPLTAAAQSDPRHQWVWHPLIDGCQGSAEESDEPEPLR